VVTTSYETAHKNTTSASDRREQLVWVDHLSGSQIRDSLNRTWIGVPWAGIRDRCRSRASGWRVGLCV